MASKKVIIGAVVVIAIIAIAAIAMSGSTHKDPNARYNYELKEVESYTSITGTVQTPDEGKKFVVLTIAIYNDSCDKAITTNPYIFEWSLSLNGIKHTYLDDESLYPAPSSVEIEKGGHATMAYCWQVDKDLDIKSATVSYDYSKVAGGAVFKQDPSIVIG